MANPFPPGPPVDPETLGLLREAKNRVVTDEPSSPPTGRLQVGGDAFPSIDVDTGDERPGLSVLDYFAAKAMAALVAVGANFSDRDLAAAAYDQAEAMLAERDRRNTIQ